MALGIKKKTVQLPKTLNRKSQTAVRGINYSEAKALTLAYLLPFPRYIPSLINPMEAVVLYCPIESTTF
jgi:hypothetical protein